MEKTIRLNKYIAQSTGVSRRRADDLIAGGHIKINNHTIYNMGTKVNVGEDEVHYHNKIITPRNIVYFAVNKPVGYTSTRYDPFADKKVTSLVPNHPPTYPVGRLDKNSEGLLIMTNDGALSQTISHPSSHIEKEYYIEAKIIKPNWDVRLIHRMEEGINIGGYKTKPSKVFGWKVEGGKFTFYIVLGEGKKRQIRRMAQKIGLEVYKLKRIRIGNLKLGDLKLGEYRKIKKDEIL